MVTKLISSFNNAIEGLLYVFRTERNMKIHFTFAILVLLISVMFKISVVDFLFLSFAITFVLMAEMFNTALEYMIDIISESYHPLVRLAKDISAGAVLIATINAIVTGYLLFAKYLSQPIVFGLNLIFESPWLVTFICILTVMVLAIGIKIFLHAGTPFYGGMPSVHTAIAFAIWAIVSILTQHPLVMALTLLIAIMVAQSRISTGAHNIQEVLFGALLGLLISIFFFQVIRR
ncbi:MAG: diacylglycerol kinase [Chlamydiota bacterium]|nr:diacylglycerol kinase [Chlamydiota bacterium]